MSGLGGKRRQVVYTENGGLTATKAWVDQLLRGSLMVTLSRWRSTTGQPRILGTARLPAVLRRDYLHWSTICVSQTPKPRPLLVSV